MAARRAAAAGLGAPGLPQDDGQREVRLRQRRVELGGAAKRGFGRLEVVLLLEGRAKVVERFGVPRVASRHVAEDLDRAAEVALVQVGGAEVVTGGLVVGVTRQDGRERRDRRLTLSEVHLHQPETVRDVVRVGVEGVRLAQRGFGAVEIAQRLQRDAELHVGAGNRGVLANRRAQMFDRAERVAALAEHDAEVVLRFGMPGIELHGAPQRGQRAIEIARPPQRGAEMIVRVEELRRHGRRLAEAGDGVSRPSELAERETEPIAGAGHVRGPLERRFERGRRAGPVSLPLELDAAGEEPRGVAGAGVRLRLSPGTAGTCGACAGQQKYRERLQCPRGESKASTHGRPMSP